MFAGWESAWKKLEVDELLFPVYIFLLAIYNWAKISAGGLSILGADMLLAIIGAFWLTRVIVRKRTIRWSWFYMLLAAYGLALTLSALNSVNVQRSTFKLLGEIYLLGVAFLTYNLVRTKEMLRRVVRSWLWATALTTVVGFIGIISYYLGYKDFRTNRFIDYYGSVPAGNFPRVSALFSLPNMTANYLGISVSMIVLSLWLGWISKKLGLGLLVGTLIVAVFTISPCLGGISLSVGIWIWIWSVRANRRRLGALALAGAIAVSGLFLFATVISVLSDHPEGFEIPVLGYRGVMSHRFHAWVDAAETMMANPIVGKGLGLPVAWVQWVTPNGNRETLTDAHNIWLSIGGQAGILGLGTFVVLVGWIVRRLKRYHPTSDPDRLLKAALAIAMLDVVFYQGISGSFEDARHIWVLFGLIVSVTEGKRFLGAGEDQMRSATSGTE